MTGHDPVEWAVTMPWNTHPIIFKLKNMKSVIAEIFSRQMLPMALVIGIVR